MTLRSFGAAALGALAVIFAALWGVHDGRVAKAQAAAAAESWIESELEYPGHPLLPLGERAIVDGEQKSMAYFFTREPPEVIVTHYRSSWRQDGLLVSERRERSAHFITGASPSRRYSVLVEESDGHSKVVVTARIEASRLAEAQNLSDCSVLHDVGGLDLDATRKLTVYDCDGTIEQIVAELEDLYGPVDFVERRGRSRFMAQRAGRKSATTAIDCAPGVAGERCTVAVALEERR